MLRFSKAQIDAARVRPLQVLWRNRAVENGLTQDRFEALEENIISWIIAHKIEDPKNVDFVMAACAMSDGAFLTADPILEAMRQAGGEYEMTVSAIRRETMSQLQQSTV